MSVETTIKVNGDASGLEAMAKRGSDAMHSLADVSERRLGRNIMRLTSVFQSAQSAGDAFAGSLHVLERTFHMGMGATVAIAAGVGLYEVFKKNQEELKKLREENEKAMILPGASQGMATVEQLTAKIEGLNERLKETRKVKEGSEGVVSWYWEQFSRFAGLVFTGDPGQGKHRASKNEETELQRKKKEFEEEAERVAYGNLEILNAELAGNKELVELKKATLKYDLEILRLNNAGAAEAAVQVQKARDIALADLRKTAANKREDLFNENHFAGQALTVETSLYANAADRQRELNEVKIAELEEKINVARKRGGALVEEVIGKLSLESEKLREQNELLSQQENIQRALVQEQRSLQAFEMRRGTDATRRQQYYLGSEVQSLEGNDRRRWELHNEDKEAKRRQEEGEKNLSWAEWAKGKNSPEAEAARQQIESAKLELARIALQRSDLERDERRQKWSLDAEEAKAKLRGPRGQRQRKELDIDLAQLEKQKEDARDPMRRREFEVAIERNKQQRADLETESERRRAAVVSSSLARIGGGGYSFSYRDPIAERVDRTNRILEQIHATLENKVKIQSLKTEEVFGREFKLSP